MDVLSRLQPLIGLVGILGLAYALSTNRRAISLRIVGWGLALQVLFALIVLKTDAGIRAFQWLGNKIQDLLHYSVEGSRFVFGPLGDVAVWSKVMNNTLGEEELNPLGVHRLPPGSRCHSNMCPTIASGTRSPGWYTKSVAGCRNPPVSRTATSM